MEKCYSCGSTGNIGKSKAKEEENFQEEEVWANWAVMKEREGSNSRPKKPHPSSSRRIPSASKMIPSDCSHGDESREVPCQPSAPMSIPDWSKIHYKKSSYMGSSEDICSWVAADDSEDTDEMVPPHEIVARRVARSPVVSSSMCEGVGRTLKGRDLSKLRNSILTKTGFLE